VVTVRDYGYQSVKESTMKIKSFGTFLLGVWLILTGLVELVQLSFSGLMPLMAIVALGAGLLIIVGK
jgi:hypothetical protein